MQIGTSSSRTTKPKPTGPAQLNRFQQRQLRRIDTYLLHRTQRQPQRLAAALVNDGGHIDGAMGGAQHETLGPDVTQQVRLQSSAEPPERLVAVRHRLQAGN